MKKFLPFCMGVLLCCTTIPVFVSAEDTLTVLMTPIEEVVVTACRVQQPTANHTEVNRVVLNQSNIGQNMPYLLSTIPALQVTSDDGLGVGYTYFRLRGIDHTRINMTINDVPLNDAESQTVFWVNMTDMAGSMGSVDVQRGVGTSTNGVASFGGSINMRTSTAQSSSFSCAFNGGMYNTFREQVNATISLPNGWHVQGRFSKVNSDGFLYRTKSNLLSYFGNIGYVNKKTTVDLLCFGGKERTGMGWDGVSYDVAYGKHGSDRRYNPAGEYVDDAGNTTYYDNTDNYAQQHVQLALQQRLSTHWTLHTTLHYTHGGGYYEQYKKKSFRYFGIDQDGKTEAIYSKNLNNHFVGAVVSTKYTSEPIDVQIGVAGNDYLGTHYGTLDYTRVGLTLPPNYEYYRAHSNKAEGNVYAKVNWRMTRYWMLYADMQYRYIYYHLWGINSETMKPLPVTEHYHFLNPKAGITYQKHGHLAYLSFAIANREPTRNNFTENDFLPSPERLYDYEVGYKYSCEKWTVSLNLYAMQYKNQLVLTGKVGDTGKQLTANVKRSYRLGIELCGGVQIAPWVRWDGNIVVSRNQIRDYHETLTRYDKDYNYVGEEDLFLKHTPIAFSPTVTAMSLFTFNTHHFKALLQTNGTSKQYLDNTGNRTAMLKGYSTTDLRLEYLLPLKVLQVRLVCQFNNLFNAIYASNGGSDCSYFADDTACWPWYYAQAGFNVHAGFQIEL